MDTSREESWICCSVATIWKKPKMNRQIDRFAISPAPSIEKWIKEMTIEEKLWLVGRTETQVLYGTKVLLLDELEEWVKVCVPGQTTSRNRLGYEGWMLACQLTKKKKKNSPSVVARIKEKRGIVYEDEACLNKWGEFSYLTEFPLISVKKNKVVIISLEGEEKWMWLKDVEVGEKKSITNFQLGSLVVETALKFIDIPYLWGGTSSFGYDCSGFVYSLYQGQGIQIPRDASEQVLEGKEVARDDIREGDVLFFAHENGKGRIHHVGVYRGDGEMIHAPNSLSSIRIEKIKGSIYEGEWAHTRRFIVH